MAQAAAGLLSSDGMYADDMLVDGGVLQTTSTVQPSPLDWASLGQSEFDLPGTSVSASPTGGADQIHN